MTSLCKLDIEPESSSTFSMPCDQSHIFSQVIFEEDADGEPFSVDDEDEWQWGVVQEGAADLSVRLCS